MGWEFNKIHMSRLAFDTCECFFFFGTVLAYLQGSVSVI